jgi:hypothetical protein
MSTDNTDNAAENVQQPPEPTTSPSVKKWSPAASCGSMTLAAAAALAGWLLMQAYHPVFEIPEELRNVSGYSPPAEQLAHAEATADVYQKNTILVFAVLGGLLGSSLGLAGGLARGSLKLAVVAVVAAGVLGVVGGGAGAILSGWTYAALKPSADQITLVGICVTRLVALGMLGLGVGLGVGLALRPTQPVVESAIFGLLAGGLAGFLYPIVIASTLPTTIMDGTLPVTPAAQAMCLLFPAVLLGLLLPMAGSQRQPRGGTKPSGA